ncbi:hypothetical protein [uncultured Ferrimonas sp.]|uniref:hypothetical protein n=1 Tax=uncultured Ferrimonas sp. TaxID=432640 RepID=UPI0026291FB5|nr:hypothetical protein [uncultured Ferrimonas sp.]
MRGIFALAALVLLSGCDQMNAAVTRMNAPISGVAGCEQGNDIVAVSAIANNPSYIILELDYCYDGAFGEDVRINLAPANRESFIPHAPIQAIVGRNQVTLTLVAQNFAIDGDTVPLSHLEVSLDLLTPADEAASRKLLSEVVSVSAILHQLPAPTAS